MYRSQKAIPVGRQGFASIILLLIIIVAAGAIFILKGNILQKNVTDSKMSPQQENIKEDWLRIEGDKILHGDEELFYNVSNVSEVRYGPGGNTVHFKIRDRNQPSAECAKIDELNQGLAPLDYPDPPPADRPWDYSRIGYAYTVQSCRSGYLKNSNLFAYLTSWESGAMLIVQLDDFTAHQIPIEKSLADKLSQNTKDDYLQLSNPVKGSDGISYVFPSEDTPVVDKKLALAFGYTIIGVDLDEQRVTGSASMIEKPYVDHLQISYHLRTIPNAPYAIAETAWEGPSKYLAIVDYSDDKLRLVPLYDLDKSGWFQNETRKYEFVDGGLDLTFYTEKDVTSEVKDIYTTVSGIEWTTESSHLFEEAEGKAEERLMEKYSRADCSFSPGIYAGCAASTDISQYRYTSGGSLKRM